MCVFVAFAADNVCADTFTDVNRFHDHILSVKGVEDVPLIVVGSKCDLDGDREVCMHLCTHTHTKFHACTI